VSTSLRGDPLTSPWMFYDSGGDYQGNRITGTVTFDGTQTLTGGTVHRDAGCVYTKIIIGDPANPTHTINVAGLTGDRVFSKAQLNAVGLVTVSDIQGYQITAAP